MITHVPHTTVNFDIHYAIHAVIVIVIVVVIVTVVVIVIVIVVVIVTVVVIVIVIVKYIPGHPALSPPHVAMEGKTVLCHFRKNGLMPVIICKNYKHLCNNL